MSENNEEVLRLRMALQKICDEYEGTGQIAYDIADRALYPGNYIAKVIPLAAAEDRQE